MSLFLIVFKNFKGKFYKISWDTSLDTFLDLLVHRDCLRLEEVKVTSSF